MKTIAFNIDGVIRNFHAQFDKHYRKVFIQNEELVEMNEDFTIKEQTEDEIKEIQEAVEKAVEGAINYPVDSWDLLNHYEFKKQVISMTGSAINTEDGYKIKENQDDIIITPREGIKKFMYETYPFQIFGKADEYQGAMEAINRIQAIGKRLGFKTKLVCVAQNAAIRATCYFLCNVQSRIKSIEFVDSENEKWDHCDVLVDVSPDAFQSKPANKTSVKIEREFNSYDNGDFSFDNVKALNNEKVLKEILGLKEK